MERLIQQIKVARRALGTLEEILLNEMPSNVERDASLQRFEYTFEAVWKAAKHYLREIEGLDIGSPKGVIRSCREVGIISNEDAIRALEMTDDRNLTSHTYNELLANQIYGRLKGHSQVMSRWLESMVEKMK